MNDVKQFFRMMRIENDSINELLDELAEKKSMAMSTGASPEGERVQSSRNLHRMEGIITDIIALEAEINEAIDKYTGRKSFAISVIRQIEDEELQEVMFTRFIEHKGVADVQVMLERRRGKNITIRGTHKVINRALKAFKDKM